MFTYLICNIKSLWSYFYHQVFLDFASDSHDMSNTQELYCLAVRLPVPVDQCYSYYSDLDLAAGTIVEVPLGGRKVIGVVWDEVVEGFDSRRMKSIIRHFPDIMIDQTLRAFVDWVGAWTLTPKGMVLRMVLRAPGALQSEVPVLGFQISGPKPARMNETRLKVLDSLDDGAILTKADLIAKANVSSAVIDGLLKAGTLGTVPIDRLLMPVDFAIDRQGSALNSQQKSAADILCQSVLEVRYQTLLLDGVTGSGKTEVYFEAVAEALKADRQVLILLPEIALTKIFLERFRKRFGVSPAEWHSDMTPKQRERVWRGVALGHLRAVVGARSALYLPFLKLGLIVVDEEHDQAYKQEEGAIYHARDMAVVRAHIGAFPIILSSATPSIESRVNADQGRYKHIMLQERYADARLPVIKAIDMRIDAPPRGKWLSPRLVSAVAETLERGEQALLFLNRRGYAPLTLCRSCGYRFSCPNCSAWLVEHRFRGVLSCHHCGHSESVPVCCPDCEADHSLVACGPGVERVAEEVIDYFEGKRVLVLSSDMQGGAKRMRDELEAIARGEIDLVIGTQLVAKGHHFPNMTLVGVVDADICFGQGDPRASERTFQLLMQVTGRAGREDKPGQGLLQTYQPDNPSLAAFIAHDKERFYAHEIATRERVSLPPFGRLAAIIISAANRAAAETYARMFVRAAPVATGFEVFGPAEAPLAVVRGRHRFRLLVQAQKSANLQAYLRHWIGGAEKAKGSVRVQIDVDPQSFL